MPVPVAVLTKAATSLPKKKINGRDQMSLIGKWLRSKTGRDVPSEFGIGIKVISGFIVKAVGDFIPAFHQSTNQTA